MGRQSPLSGEVRVPGVSNGDKLHHLLHDTLTEKQRGQERLRAIDARNVRISFQIPGDCILEGPVRAALGLARLDVGVGDSSDRDRAGMARAAPPRLPYRRAP